MPEVVTTTAATVATVSFLGKDLIQKVLGPSSEYLGEQLKLFTQKNVENLKSIFEKAEEKLPEQTEDQGSVPPQIIRDVLFDGSFCEDEVSQEYYAGILASSKTKNTFDTRGKAITSIIRELSNYQLTTHYILYRVYQTYVWDSGLTSFIGAREVSFLDNDYLIQSFKLTKQQIKTESQALIEHVLYGLQSHDLVKGVDAINQMRGLSPKGQFHYLPTPKGIELFLWANGYGNKTVDFFYSKECLIDELKDFNFDFSL